MTVVIRLSGRAELRALPILMRHSPGTVLPGRIYVIREEAAHALKQAGAPFTVVCREAMAPELNQGGSASRVRRI
jgi:hypothetical protein